MGAVDTRSWRGCCCRHYGCWGIGAVFVLCGWFLLLLFDCDRDDSSRGKTIVVIVVVVVLPSLMVVAAVVVRTWRFK